MVGLGWMTHSSSKRRNISKFRTICSSHISSFRYACAWASRYSALSASAGNLNNAGKVPHESVFSSEKCSSRSLYVRGKMNFFIAQISMTDFGCVSQIFGRCEQKSFEFLTEISLEEFQFGGVKHTRNYRRRMCQRVETCYK